MSDVLNAPATPGTPAVPVTPAAVEAPKSIAEANAVVKKLGATWDDVKVPGAVDATPELPTDGMSVTDGEVEEVAAPAAEAGDEYSLDEQGRWHRADGTMASADEITQITAQIASETNVTEEAKPEATENVVTLRRRDGTTRDVIVDDPELAQEIRQNMNDGLRRRDYDTKMADLETKDAEFREFQAMLRANPEGVILQHLPPEKQVNIAAALLAQHFDALVPIIQGYDANPSTRLNAVTESQRAIREQEGQFQSLVVSQRQASEVKQAVAALIPETIADDVQEKFWKFASMELTAAVDSKQTVNKETVKTILADLCSHFGFQGAAIAAPTTPRITLATPATPASPSPAAQPANDAAKQLADAQKAQKRIRLRQQQRINAAAVPPSGAGAAPMRLPAIPAGASLQEANKAMRNLGGSWASSS